MLYAIIYTCSVLLTEQCTPEKATSMYSYPCESQVPTGCIKEAEQMIARMASFDGAHQQPLFKLAHR